MATRRRPPAARPRTRATRRGSVRRVPRFSPDVTRSLVAVVLMVLGAVILIGLVFQGRGALTDWILNVIAPWFGSGRWLLPLILIGLGVWLERAGGVRAGWPRTLLGTAVAYVAALALIALLADAGVLDGRSGGDIGRGLGTFVSGLVSFARRVHRLRRGPAGRARGRPGPAGPGAAGAVRARRPRPRQRPRRSGRQRRRGRDRTGPPAASGRAGSAGCPDDAPGRQERPGDVETGDPAAAGAARAGLVRLRRTTAGSAHRGADDALPGRRGRDPRDGRAARHGDRLRVARAGHCAGADPPGVPPPADVAPR